jgi:hypothetical protein
MRGGPTPGPSPIAARGICFPCADQCVVLAPPLHRSGEGVGLHYPRGAYVAVMTVFSPA